MEKPATVGQIWDTTKTYMNSSMVKKYDGVLSPETSQGLGNFLMTNPKAMGLGISQEAKTDDRLQKYNIIQMYPTKRKDEFENLNDVYIITDPKQKLYGKEFMMLKRNLMLKLKCQPKAKMDSVIILW